MWTVFWTAIGLIVLGVLLGTIAPSGYSDASIAVGSGILFMLAFFKCMILFSE